MPSTTSPPSSHLLNCPTEILIAISRHLPNRDVKRLRLSCTRLKAVAPLRLDRVFLSANPRNVAVFNAVAAHDVYRHQVVEIIWDDALLVEDATRDWDSWLGTSDDGFYYGEVDEDTGRRRGNNDDEGFPRWFGRACKESLETIISADLSRREMADWTTRPMLRISECWVYYQALLAQQRDVLRSGAHVHALEDAWRLRRFPNVRTITVTPAAHGRLFYPLFETPMIRAFPPGFNYLIPRGWPVYGAEEDGIPQAEEWEDDGDDWPGFRIVTSIVARYPDIELSELRVDAFQIATGLNVRVFEEPCRALADFTTIVTRPSFQHLHLDLMVSGQENYEWEAFKRGHLARALSVAKLQSLSIRTDVAGGLVCDGYESPVPLRTIFTPASLSCMRHFGLSGFYVREEELLQVLTDLPLDLLETVELSFLWFFKERPAPTHSTTNTNHNNPVTSSSMRNGFFGYIIELLYPSHSVDYSNHSDNANDSNSNYEIDTNGSNAVSRLEAMGHLLERIRDELPWRNVKLTIGEPADHEMDGRARWASADDFLHRGGENPCSEAFSQGTRIAWGFGVEEDVFDESYERPYVESEEALGYRYWYDELKTFKCHR
ncbi:hypothetical protein PG993_000038 [Apiospora rasikravindrae]|uniref:F-box domain-containing protein n=1 Tax=Apiospora rasikravindrae TaxID=990691 RepID=A0ABR1U7C4_9PEZI